MLERIIGKFKSIMYSSLVTKDSLMFINYTYCTLSFSFIINDGFSLHMTYLYLKYCCIASYSVAQAVVKSSSWFGTNREKRGLLSNFSSTQLICMHLRVANYTFYATKAILLVLKTHFQDIISHIQLASYCFLYLLFYE